MLEDFFKFHRLYEVRETQEHKHFEFVLSQRLRKILTFDNFDFVILTYRLDYTIEESENIIIFLIFSYFTDPTRFQEI